MASSDLATAAKRYRDAKSALDKARQALAAAIVDAARSGVPQTEIVATVPYTREQVRQLCREGGLTAEVTGRKSRKTTG